MRKILFACVISLNILTIIAQDIPEGITYITAPDEENEKAIKYLTDLLYSSSDVNLPKAIGCGPFFWQELVGYKIFSEDVGIPMEIRIPTGDKVQTLMGRVIRWEDKTKQLQTLLRTTFQKSGSFNIRKLTAQEMQVYWMMITYDIQEPIFIIESPGFNLLVDLGNDGELFYMDNFYRLLQKK